MGCRRLVLLGITNRDLGSVVKGSTREIWSVPYCRYLELFPYQTTQEKKRTHGVGDQLEGHRRSEGTRRVTVGIGETLVIHDLKNKIRETQVEELHRAD